MALRAPCIGRNPTSTTNMSYFFRQRGRPTERGRQLFSQNYAPVMARLPPLENGTYEKVDFLNSCVLDRSEVLGASNCYDWRLTTFRGKVSCTYLPLPASSRAPFLSVIDPAFCHLTSNPKPHYSPTCSPSEIISQAKLNLTLLCPHSSKEGRGTQVCFTHAIDTLRPKHRW